MLDRGVIEIDGPGKRGMSSPPSDKIIGGEFPYISGIDVPCHQVPAVNRLRLKSLAFSINANVAGLTNVVSNNCGTYNATIGGVQMTEGRYLDNPMPVAAGGDELVNPWYSAFQLPSVGEGIVCPASTQFLVRATPASAGPTVWTTTVIGRRGTTTDIQSSRTVTSRTTANQTILSYTPASDWTIMSISVSCDSIGQVRGQGRICIGGVQVMELPYLGQEASSPTFTREDCYAGCYGALTLPLWGIDVGETTYIGFEADSFTDDGARWQMTVAGTEESLSPTPAEIAAAVWSRSGRTLTS